MLLGQDETSLWRITSDIGGVLESFTAMELGKNSTWGKKPCLSANDYVPCP